MSTRSLLVCLALVFVSPAAGCSGPPSVTPGGSSVAGAATVYDASGRRTGSPAGQVTITEFRDLKRGHVPFCLAAGSDGALWVTDDIDQDSGTSFVVRVTTDGRRTAAYGYGASAYPAATAIVSGPDGALWLIDEGDGDVVRMTTSGAFTTSPYLGAYDLIDIAAGPDGALWVTASGPSIFRITTGMSVTKFSNGISPNAGVQNITAGPDGALWFTEDSGNRIGRISTSGAVTEYSQGISADAQPYAITAGPDGALWFTELAGRIGRITTAGVVTEYTQGTMRRRQPVAIAAGPDGALWFTETREARIGRITTTGQIAEYAAGLARDAGPTCIVAGADGNMWFNASGLNDLGRVNL